MKTKWKNSSAVARNRFVCPSPVLLLVLCLGASSALRAQTISAPVEPPVAPSADASKPVQVGKLSPGELKAQQAKDAAARNRAVVRPAPEATPTDAAPADLDAQDKPDAPSNPLDYVKDNEWQKHAEIRSGNVIFLRRSTDTPPAPNETVILRFRTPTEFRNKAFMSSKSHLPNWQGQ